MKTRINPNAFNPMEMNQMSSMMGMMSSLQKIGKGKRKYSVSLDKSSKKFLVKFIDEVKKQFSGSAMADQNKQIYDFLVYVKEIVEKKESTELKVSFEEEEFLKRMLKDSLRGMEGMEFQWYQFIKKRMVKMLASQYRDLLAKFK